MRCWLRWLTSTGSTCASWVWILAVSSPFASCLLSSSSSISMPTGPRYSLCPVFGSGLIESEDPCFLLNLGLIQIPYIRTKFLWPKFKKFKLKVTKKLIKKRFTFPSRPLWRILKLHSSLPTPQREHPALQNMNNFHSFFHFLRPCWSSWIRIPNPFADQQAQMNTDPIQIRNWFWPQGWNFVTLVSHFFPTISLLWQLRHIALHLEKTPFRFYLSVEMLSLHCPSWKSPKKFITFFMFFKFY